LCYKEILCSKQERVEEIEKVFDLKSIKTCIKAVDNAYKNKIALGELRAYIEEQTKKVR